MGIQRQKRLELAANQYAAAQKLALNAGMLLLKHTDYHYSLRKDGWKMDIWPSTYKFHCKFEPFIRPVEDWTLIQIVSAAVNTFHFREQKQKPLPVLVDLASVIAIVESEEEFEGDPPKDLLDRMIAMGPVANARHSVKVTKINLIKRLRAAFGAPVETNDACSPL